MQKQEGRRSKWSENKNVGPDLSASAEVQPLALQVVVYQRTLQYMKSLLNVGSSHLPCLNFEHSVLLACVASATTILPSSSKTSSISPSPILDSNTYDCEYRSTEPAIHKTYNVMALTCKGWLGRWAHSRCLSVAWGGVSWDHKWHGKMDSSFNYKHILWYLIFQVRRSIGAILSVQWWLCGFALHGRCNSVGVLLYTVCTTFNKAASGQTSYSYSLDLDTYLGMTVRSRKDALLNSSLEIVRKLPYRANLWCLFSEHIWSFNFSSKWVVTTSHWIALFSTRCLLSLQSRDPYMR